MIKRRTTFLMTLLILLSLFLICLVACNGEKETEQKEEPEVQTYKVIFMVDEEVYDTSETEVGENVKFPVNPEKNGYVFKGWYDEEGKSCKY